MDQIANENLNTQLNLNNNNNFINESSTNNHIIEVVKDSGTSGTTPDKMTEEIRKNPRLI